MHLGLIGGIGPAATDFYYRGLIRAAAAVGRDLEATIVHADAPTLIRNQGADDQDAQAAVFARLIERLRDAGSTTAAVTSIAGHFCMDALRPRSALPLNDLIDAVAAELSRRGAPRVGVIGTKRVMETRFYRRLAAYDIVAPQGDEADAVHQAYVEMAASGVVDPAHRQVFVAAGRRLCDADGAAAVMLGGTDLFLAFNGGEPVFPVIDCAQIHVDALARIAVA